MLSGFGGHVCYTKAVNRSGKMTTLCKVLHRCGQLVRYCSSICNLQFNEWRLQCMCVCISISFDRLLTMCIKVKLAVQGM